ncbi:response regulator transcription factor [Metasolibacillus sp. FSL K6-0083]|uniref:response regulator transcription factor n=1 Tax=Metasolibacillus sp. FSL K6-0083 TaxID=2921416 RepID=UPI00315A4184
MTINVLLVDDHIIVLEGLKKILENDMEIQVVGMVSDPSTLAETIKQLQPDIILMDIQMKGYNGLLLTKELLKDNKELAIIMLSGYNDDAYLQGAYNAGARSFIAKDQPPRELIATIKVVYEGSSAFPSFVQGQVDFLLTPKEQEVLRILATGKSNIELSETLNISKRTVEHHITSLMRKLHVDNRMQIVMKAMDKGLIRN